MGSRYRCIHCDEIVPEGALHSHSLSEPRNEISKEEMELIVLAGGNVRDAVWLHRFLLKREGVPVEQWRKPNLALLSRDEREVFARGGWPETFGFDEDNDVFASRREP